MLPYDRLKYLRNLKVLKVQSVRLVDRSSSPAGEFMK